MACLLTANAAALWLYVTAERQLDDLQSRSQAASQYLTGKSPDIAAAKDEEQRWQSQIVAAQASMALPKADWQVVETVQAVAREAGVTLQFGGTQPGRSTEINGVTYISVPVSVGARGSLANLERFLSGVEGKLETFDIQQVSLSGESGQVTMVLKGAVYWESPADQSGQSAAQTRER
jgi:hypothetical protein